MLNSIITLIQEVQTMIVEEIYELPIVSPKVYVQDWFPIYDLEEIIIHK